ncbi:DUF349 domain-containing protein [Corynebacterium pseudopelargi]|uniref:DNA repair ATPase n=1 Tax=Corynebacterium pseudopelargi TaxID=2080757 RepID=A0A3G6ITZ2_9CORY|nr:DUF349 domain-containing protein [Corynebacterium pseudopelargi]AZA09093.1 hypothetical protein CPPEL_04830 [Corynebacterium pseudopelargi]
MTTSNTPKPGPRPGAHPGPKPGPVPGQHAKSHHTPTPGVFAHSHGDDPLRFGRVDDQGNVFLRRGDNERQIASWQAGTPEEGLRHYAQRYEDLATEIVLLETRLQTHPGDAAHTKQLAQELRDGLDDAAVIGDIDALDARLASIIDHADDAGEQAKVEKAKRREAAIAKKEALAKEAEDIAEHSTEWKAAGDRIRAILEEWKGIRGIDRKTDDQLWKRYSRARDAFNRRRGTHFAELDRGRAAAKRTKEALVEQAEAIKDSTDWNETARAFRDLMDQWRKAGRAPREVDDKLWASFKAAQDTFFSARNAVQAERDREFEDNAKAKDELLEIYGPQINPALDLEGAKEKLRELQEKWESIGFVPRARIREFEDKIAKIERDVAGAEDQQWRRTDPEAQARAAQFRAKVAEFEQQAQQAEAKGKNKKAEQLREQAKQWQEWADAAEQAVADR